VPHKPTGMARVEKPAQGLGEIIGRVIDTRNMEKHDIASFFPILNGKMLDVNMSGARGRATRINHLDGGNVIFVERRRRSLGKPELGKDGTEVLGNLGSGDGSDEFSFSGASGGSRLCLGAIGNGTTSKSESIASSRPTLSKIVGIGGVNIANELRGSSTRSCEGVVPVGRAGKDSKVVTSEPRGATKGRDGLGVDRQ